MKHNSKTFISCIPDKINLILPLLLQSFLVALLITILIVVSCNFPANSLIPILIFTTSLVFPVAVLLHKKYGKRYSLGIIQGIALIFAITGLIFIFLSSYPHIWENTQWEPSILSLGVGLLSFSIAIFALILSRKSDERMHAMANLEFYEKVGIIERYLYHIKNSESIFIQGLYYDIKSAKQLDNYVNPHVRAELMGKIKELKIASEGHHQAEDIVRCLRNIMNI